MKLRALVAFMLAMALLPALPSAALGMEYTELLRVIDGDVIGGTDADENLFPDHILEGDLRANAAEGEICAALTVTALENGGEIPPAVFEVTGSVVQDAGEYAVAAEVGTIGDNSAAVLTVGKDLAAASDVNACALSVSALGTGSRVYAAVGGDAAAVITGDSEEAASFGIGFESDGSAETEVVVEGTVSGGTAAVVLWDPVADMEEGEDKPVFQVGSQVTLAVWALKENSGGALVLRPQMDEDGEWAYRQDRQAEAAVRYLIRVEAGQEEYVSVDAKEFEAFSGRTYLYACEGETVPLKLNIPDGSVLEEVTGGAADVSVDENGEYSLVIPRGGGVMVSLKLSPKAD